MKIASILITAFNFFSFLLSVLNVFKKMQDINKFKQISLKILSLSTWVTILFYMTNTLPNLYMDTVNFFTQTLLFFLFWKTASIVKKNQFSIVYSNDLPNKIVCEGLYKKIRHPFYMIYILSYFFSALSANSYLCICLALLMVALYYDAAKTEENKFAATDLHNEYMSYKKTAGLFWPKLN